MNIIINHQTKEVPEAATLEDIVTPVTGPLSKGIAVAVNNTVIPRSAHAGYTLQPGDNILIIKATQGG